LPGKSHGWRSLVGYSPWGRKELDTTERLQRRGRGGDTGNRNWKTRIVRVTEVWEAGEKACLLMSDGDSRSLEDTYPSQAQVK